VGQAELEVMSVADTVVVVLMPEVGDAIQTLKAGLTEIADIFVVNKADREGSARLVAELEAMLGLAQKPSWWQPPVLSTQAHQGTGLDQLHEAIQRHRAAQEQSSRLAEKRRQRQRREFLQALQDGVGDLLRQWERWSSGGLGEVLARVETGRQDPYVAARQVLSSGSLVREWLEALEQGRHA
jgi:LAO/AO transport system kinase